MTAVRNLFFLFAITLFGFTSTILAIFNYNPYQASASTFANFYVSFAVAATGIISLLVLYIRSRKKLNENVNPYLWSSIRQAFIASAGITMLLVLRGLRTLDWLIAISIIVVCCLLELFFKTKKAI